MAKVLSKITKTKGKFIYEWTYLDYCQEYVIFQRVKKGKQIKQVFSGNLQQAKQKWRQIFTSNNSQKSNQETLKDKDSRENKKNK